MMGLVKNLFNERKADIFEEGARRNTLRFRSSIARRRAKFTLSREAIAPKVIGEGVKNLRRATPTTLKKENVLVKEKVRLVMIEKPKKPERAKLTFFGREIR